MKKAILIIGGLGLAGFGLYRYFKYQVDQALNYEYKIKDLRLVKVDGNKITISVTVEMTNNSNFSLKINEYDIQMFFKDIPFATTKSTQPITVNPSSVFNITAEGVIDLSEVKEALIPFLTTITNNKPIDIQVSGSVKIEFMGISSTINLQKKAVNYSVDLLKEYGLDENWQKLKGQISKIVGYLGIKI